jgi:GDP-L-fucose synthase
MKNVLVTGGSGLLGKSLKEKEKNFIYISSKDVDLTDKHETKLFLSKYKPETIIHLAAKVGGIKDNFEYPYDFISINNSINTNVIDYCNTTNTKIIFASSTCVYPKTPNSYPLIENMVDSGEPETTNESYAYAKRFAKHMLMAAKKQFNLNYTILYFCNLYGEHDDFLNENKSHLVTSLIHKFHQAKINNKDEVVLWGTGSPMRQFMHADDAAEIIRKVLHNNINGEYNVAIDDNLTVKQIAETVKQIVGYTGSVYFNNHLDGVYRKDASSKKLLDIIGEYNFIKLEDGVKRTYKLLYEKK